MPHIARKERLAWLFGEARFKERGSTSTANSHRVLVSLNREPVGT
jgi:hypothetical protein